MHLKLFVSFFKIGLFTYGGGYAMMPLLDKEVVQKRQWMSLNEVMDFYAIGQVIPGIIAINTALFVGYKKKKHLGALVSVLGFILPSIIIITVLYNTLLKLDQYPWVQHAFSGIRIAVSALIFNTVYSMLKKGVIDKITALFFALTVILVFYFKINPIYPIVVAGALGILVSKKGGQNDPS